MQTNHQFFLHDFGLLPALLEDYGYYLIKKDIDMFFQTRECDYEQQPLQFIDKKLGFISNINELVREGDKHRLYIHTWHLSTICGRPAETILQTLGEFMGRMVLGTLTKYNHDRTIHSDYVIVGSDRVYRPTEKQRRQDIRMIQKVHAIREGRDFLDIVSSHGSLYPNTKAVYSGIFQLEEDEKKNHQAVAEQTRDVSVMWQCGIKRRLILRQNKIYRWDDPAFPDCFFDLVLSPSRMDIIQRMLSLSITTPHKDFSSSPKNEMLEKFPMLTNKLSSWVFVDFETDFQKCIYLVGYYTEQSGYQCLWSDNLDPWSEKELMRETYSVLNQYKKKGFGLCYYVAERMFWLERCSFHKLEEYTDLFDGMLDLSHVFMYGSFLIRNVFNFKLKNIASQLFRMGYIGLEQPKGCVDGAQSVEIAKQFFQTRCPTFSYILEQYNQFDCQILYELLMFLKEYYQC